MKEIALLEIELPNGWSLDKNHLKIFIERDTVMKVREVKEIKYEKKDETV